MRETEQEGLTTRSEAVYLDCVSDDGAAGFVVRLCRYPEAGFAWSWGHLFVAGRTYAFTDHTFACSADVTDVEAVAARYSLDWPEGGIRFARKGTRNAPQRCHLESSFRAHAAAHPPHGNGAVACTVEAQFRPTATAVSNRAGRSEVLGSTACTVSVDDHGEEIVGRSQFHEQVQTDARFNTPFSYLTLRGEAAGLVAIRAVRGARGHLLTAGSALAISRIELTPPGSTRKLVLHGADGERVEGELNTTYDYSVPVFDGYRPGTIVAGTLGGSPVSGCVNDYLLDQLRFDRI